MKRVGEISSGLVWLLALFACGNNGQELDTCDYQLVETIPDGLVFEKELNFKTATTDKVWLELINNSKKTLQIITFQFSLLAEPKFSDHPTAEPGRLVFEAIESAAARGVKVEIMTGLKAISDLELNRLNAAGVDFKFFDVTRLLGKGIQHAKYIISDETSFYLGSANSDWRALTHVKEIGIVYKQCQTLANDLAKIAKTYSFMDKQESVPEFVPEELISKINSTEPMKLVMDGIHTSVYFGTSPPQFDGANNHRSQDLDAILNMIANAKEYIYIAVMNYSTKYFGKKGEYWNVISDALKDAYRKNKVQVKIIFSKSSKTNSWEIKPYQYLNSLRDDSAGIEVRLFSVPIQNEFQESIPFARLKHDKFIVTDQGTYIGTSNWKPEYFDNTTGVGLTITPDATELKQSSDNIVSRMKEIFLRDWDSEFVMGADDPKAAEPNRLNKPVEIVP